MRQIKEIIVHCSDSDIKAHDDISVIESWHIARGFKKVGYHYFIKADGTIQIGRQHSEMGAHCVGHNSKSIGICLHGRYNFTEIQFHTLKALLYDLTKEFNLDSTNVFEHNKFDKNKTCPNFKLNEI